MEDPIITAIHRHREAFARKFKYNVRAMLEDVRKREKASGHPVVSFAPVKESSKPSRRRQPA